MTVRRRRGRTLRPSASEAAIEIIRDRILDLTLSPGIRIDDKLLTERFGMGRTPAREAFGRLAAEGLIVIQRNRGAFVRPLDIEHVRQFFDAYIASERVVGFFCNPADPSLAALKAIDAEYQLAYRQRKFLEMTQINSRFHGLIAAATSNEYVAEHAQRLYNHARRISYFISMTEAGYIVDLHKTQRLIKADHTDIMRTIEGGRPAALVDVLTRHATMFHDRTMNVISRLKGAKSPLPVRARG